MSGHSKWATTKHQKAAKDKARAKDFAKLLRMVEVSARQGGGDLDGNPTLRTAFEKARKASVPVDTINKAIKRGTGELEGVQYTAINYEGYAPCGVAVYVETLSDNRNRTGAEIRNAFSKNGGSMAEPGAVAWQFERKGQLLLPKDGNPADEDELMMQVAEAGGDDLSDIGEQWEVTCEGADLHTVRSGLEEQGLKVDEENFVMAPTQTVEIGSAEDLKKVMRVMDALDDHDDVQNVFSNFDAADDLFAALGS